MAMLEAIHSCPHCGGVLLACDLRGRSCGFMDRALAHHLRGACVGAALLDDPSEVWPDFEPPLAMAIRARKVEQAVQMVVNGEAQRSAPLDSPLRLGSTALHLAAAADLGDSHAAYQLEIVQRHLAVVEEFAQRVHVLRQPANLRDGAELALGLGDHERRRRLSQ